MCVCSERTRQRLSSGWPGPRAGLQPSSGGEEGSRQFCPPPGGGRRESPASARLRLESAIPGRHQIPQAATCRAACLRRRRRGRRGADPATQQPPSSGRADARALRHGHHDAAPLLGQGGRRAPPRERRGAAPARRPAARRRLRGRLLLRPGPGRPAALLRTAGAAGGLLLRRGVAVRRVTAVLSTAATAWAPALVSFDHFLDGPYRALPRPVGSVGIIRRLIIPTPNYIRLIIYLTTPNYIPN